MKESHIQPGDFITVEELEHASPTASAMCKACEFYKKPQLIISSVINTNKMVFIAIHIFSHTCPNKGVSHYGLLIPEGKRPCYAQEFRTK